MKENANTNQQIEFNKARKNLQDTYINEQTKYLQKQIDDKIRQLQIIRNPL